jgi:tRNA-specific 2-thiouridylase
MYHTLGQRKGLGIGGLKDGAEDPWYVVAKDLVNNHLIVAQGHDHPSLFSKGLVADQLHWVDRTGPSSLLRCTVKTRYRQQDIDCTLTPNADGTVTVLFDQPQKAVTPGQSAVFYLNDVCLGGGIIDQAVL